ncbi:hypothetical protein N0V93_005892 [Gnomoniopsis smithogilvyi]|uniref:Uncharacterized protein n=1 Tax=Gnomoniopsis smithogilvyi TaxID=1191159 RepID=A0A9W9CX47_9PEZI|nr:hypothetical protein N0V93_005892 [Gnomoniopsis smithogilvyi]
MDDGSRRQGRNLLATAVWDSHVDDNADAKLSAYFTWIQREFYGITTDELVFFVDIIRSNMTMKRSSLIQAVRLFKDSWGDQTKSVIDKDFQNPAASSVTDQLKQSLREDDSSIEDQLLDAVRAVFALELARDQNTVGGVLDPTFWESHESLSDVISKSFPKQKLRQNSQISQRAILIDSKNLAAKYLEDHANVKIQWTSNLVEHLWLQDKTLYVFDLACMLERAYNTRPAAGINHPCNIAESVPGLTGDNLPTKVGASGEGTAEDDHHMHTFEGSDQIHRSDREGMVSEEHTGGSQSGKNVKPAPPNAWLKTKLKPHVQWPRLWLVSLERDARLAAAELSGRPLEAHKQYLEEVRDTQKLFELYPHWAIRWQRIHQEAEAPTPVSRLDKWAQRRRDERHAFKVAYLALHLAIGFGVVATVLGVLQLWVSYCQWRVQDGGYGCGPVKGSSQGS